MGEALFTGVYCMAIMVLCSWRITMSDEIEKRLSNIEKMLDAMYERIEDSMNHQSELSTLRTFVLSMWIMGFTFSTTGIAQIMSLTIEPTPPYSIDWKHVLLLFAQYDLSAIFILIGVFIIVIATRLLVVERRRLREQHKNRTGFPSSR